jgi:hypothetical protein
VGQKVVSVGQKVVGQEDVSDYQKVGVVGQEVVSVDQKVEV